MVSSGVFSWVNWIHKQHIDFMILLDRIYLELPKICFAKTFSITLSKSTLKSRWICINASDDNLSLFIVDRTYVFNRRSTLNDRSAVALVTGIVNMIHKMVSIEGYSTGFTTSSVSQSEVGIWSRGVILQRVRHRTTSLLNSSKLHVRSVWCRDLFVRNISYNTRKQILCIEAIFLIYQTRLQFHYHVVYKRIVQRNFPMLFLACLQDD
jgi:hypothetical protein